jgi:hypothetical protein
VTTGTSAGGAGAAGTRGAGGAVANGATTVADIGDTEERLADGNRKSYCAGWGAGVFPSPMAKPTDPRCDVCVLFDHHIRDGRNYPMGGGIFSLYPTKSISFRLCERIEIHEVVQFVTKSEIDFFKLSYPKRERTAMGAMDSLNLK